MPFDGIVAKSITEELNDTLLGGRVEKIFQPEADEIILNIRSKGQNRKLILSASPNYPRIHITEGSKENPSAPPVFCMLLRKHLSGGKITGIDFFDFERIISIHVESLNELGDLTEKKLIIEIMGRHSNIILINEQDKILDSIKHVDNEVSSVREVMPARPYVLPPAQDKISPLTLDIDKMLENGRGEAVPVEKFFLNKIKGFSPLLCREICSRADIEGKTPVSGLTAEMLYRIKVEITKLIESIAGSDFKPCVVFEDNKMESPLDFHCVEITQYSNVRYLTSISEVLDTFYARKDKAERLKQKKSGILKVLNNSVERCNKKIALHQDKLRDVSDRENLKLYGELITANIYCIPKGSKKISLMNYYSENEEFVEISLDENLTPQENAQRLYKQYAKAKTAFSYTSEQMSETLKELNYLESVLHLLDNCVTLQEIDEIRQELIEQGYMTDRKRSHGRKQDKASAPLHYKSSDGFDIFVGKNNKQNDLLTMKLSSSNDTWLHTKDIPGSHVLIRKQQNSIPDSTLLEAAMLAAYHSKARMSSGVAVDYTTVKNVRKSPGAKPGMVIYENYKTIIVTPDESIANKLKAGI